MLRALPLAPMKLGDRVSVHGKPGEIIRAMPVLGEIALYRVRFDDHTTAYAKPHQLKPLETLL